MPTLKHLLVYFSVIIKPRMAFATIEATSERDRQFANQAVVGDSKISEFTSEPD